MVIMCSYSNVFHSPWFTRWTSPISHLGLGAPLAPGGATVATTGAALERQQQQRHRGGLEAENWRSSGHCHWPTTIEVLRNNIQYIYIYSIHLQLSWSTYIYIYSIHLQLSWSTYIYIYTVYIYNYPEVHIYIYIQYTSTIILKYIYIYICVYTVYIYNYPEVHIYIYIEFNGCWNMIFSVSFFWTFHILSTPGWLYTLI